MVLVDFSTTYMQVVCCSVCRCWCYTISSGVSQSQFDSRLPSTANFMMQAAEEGRLALLKWARGQGCPWDSRAPLTAAQRGHLSVLQWLRDQGCPMKPLQVGIAAARAGQRAVLWWGIKEVVPPCFPIKDGRLCDAAARGGHGELLLWLREEGCPWRQEHHHQRRARGSLPVVGLCERWDVPSTLMSCVRWLRGGTARDVEVGER